MRLNWLGFRFIAGILGLINEGEAGSDSSETVLVVAANGGWIERPFMFRARRGEGEVIGRCRRIGSGATPSDSVLTMGLLGNMLKVVEGKLFSGIRLIGESGDEEGDGSDKGEESVVERVVVGDESADSEV